MSNIPRGLIKHGIMYYLGAMTSFLAITNIPSNLRFLLIVILLIVGGYGAYLNYLVDRKGWAIILAGITLFFIPCLQGGYSSQAGWKLYYLIAGFVFTIFFVVTVITAIKKTKK
jgi:hypothetical protein